MQIQPAWDDRKLNTTWQSSEKSGIKICFKANMQEGWMRSEDKLVLFLQKSDY